ncbi:MAG: hypothetical protein RhofKO_25560 [Rhodothermales bacterium]
MTRTLYIARDTDDSLYLYGEAPSCTRDETGTVFYLDYGMPLYLNEEGTDTKAILGFEIEPGTCKRFDITGVEDVAYSEEMPHTEEAADA